MQVVSLEVRQVRIGLRRPVQHASHTRTSTDNIVVICQLSDGSVGYGEGVPREYVTGETTDTAIELLKQADWSTQLHACASFVEAVHMAEKLRLPTVPGDDRNCQGNAARCAVEIAVLDAYGRALGEPLMNIVKVLSPGLYEPREKVQYSGVILSAKRWKARLLALYYRLTGFQHIKVKVAIPGQDDVKRLRRIRGWAGSAINLRIDANEGWTLDQAAETIPRLEAYEIKSVEQPLPHEQITQCAALAKSIHTPILLDESLCSEVDAERAIREQWGQAFNLRLSKCGGFIPTLRLAEFAARHQLDTQLGCQVGETAILSAAGRQFASVVRGLTALEGSYDRHLVEHNLAREDLTFGRGGWAPMLVGSGLGIRIDETQLETCTVRKEVLIA